MHREFFPNEKWSTWGSTVSIWVGVHGQSPFISMQQREEANIIYVTSVVDRK